MQLSPTMSLTEAVWPRTGVARDVLLIVGFALFTAVAAQISLTPPGWFVELFGALGPGPPARPPPAPPLRPAPALRKDTPAEAPRTSGAR